MKKLEKEASKKPPAVSDRRFRIMRREYDKFAKELSRKIGVDRATLEEAIATYGFEVVKKAAEIERQESRSLSKIFARIKGLWARR